VLVSICWVGFVGGYGMYKWYNDPVRPALPAVLSEWCNQPDDPVARAICEEAKKRELANASLDHHDLFVVLFSSIGPPIALLLFGAALYWVGRGFREN
jgi:hypothetical protein